MDGLDGLDVYIIYNGYLISCVCRFALLANDNFLVLRGDRDRRTRVT